ncbi:MAG: dehydrogenase E1 component subunit alpha/beta, partial [Verrucomicrobiae bacterium]|nr:dehydrogenase E1 component subunit alpha/beta [Verrucomicrobiae bacterium]
VAAEVHGRATGASRGFGGSMHLFWKELNFMGGNGIVGGGIPLSLGTAYAAVKRGTDQVTVVFFGDGASSQGSFHESLNMAAIEKWPVVFVCENNLYAATTHVSGNCPIENIGDRAAAYGIPGIVADGNDLAAVIAAAQTAVARARRGEGPTLVEFKTYRHRAHCMVIPEHRPNAERAHWRQRDPIELLGARLIADGVADQAELDRIRKQAARRLEEALAFMRRSPLPDPTDIEKVVFAPGPTVAATPPPQGATRKLTPIKAMNEALSEEMQRDENVVLFGEDIGAYGGVWALSKGLQKKFGERRVFDTPLSETAIMGTAAGAAMAGLRPVIEIMYVDFMTCCMDPLVNQAAKIRFMSGGAFSLPMTIIAPCGAGTCEAAQHSQSLEAWFLNTPGLKVVMPSTAADCKGLLKTSIRDNNPVMFLWHKCLYDLEGEVPEGEWTIPLGQAAVRREGTDVTLVAYSLMAHRALEAAAKLEGEISVEVIDPRTLRPFDLDAVLRSLRKTGRLLVVHESPATCGVGAEIVRQVTDNAFDLLKQAPRIVGGKDLPIPFAKPLENAVVPQVDDIVTALRRMIGGCEK